MDVDCSDLTQMYLYIGWVSLMQGFTYEKNRRAINRSPKYAKFRQAIC